MDRFLARQGIRTIALAACQLLAASILLAVAVGVSGARSPHFSAVSSEGATVASTVTYLLPVVAIVLGVLVLRESITAAALAGIALVLAGVVLTRHHGRGRR